jgi:hypothetical protein
MFLAAGVMVVVVAVIVWQWPLIVDWFDMLFGTNQGV